MSDDIVIKHIEARRRSLELCPNLKVEERSNLILQVIKEGKKAKRIISKSVPHSLHFLSEPPFKPYPCLSLNGQIWGK